MQEDHYSILKIIDQVWEKKIFHLNSYISEVRLLFWSEN